MKTTVATKLAIGVILLGAMAMPLPAEVVKPTPSESVQKLKNGNKRFAAGKSIHPNLTPARLAMAGRENQRDHAFATVITCSDSRVPAEMIFDVGVMDIFVIRVAGNVCNTDEAGSIEYGLAHVKTPVLVFLGHTQCGAVAAVTKAVQGHGEPLERNIPPLVAAIAPAVRTAMKDHPGVSGAALISYATEQNVWRGIEDLFMKSPYTREAVKRGKVKVVGAIYNVGNGEVKWLAESKVGEILQQVEKNPRRALNVMAVPAPVK